jgi:hypothetical protein
MIQLNSDQSGISTERVFSTPQEVAYDIADELRKHPDRWTQGCNARQADGLICGVHDAEATCWCLLGHIIKRNEEFAFKPIRAAFGHPTVSWAAWNDSPERTVDDVIALCARVACGPATSTEYSFNSCH